MPTETDSLLNDRLVALAKSNAWFMSALVAIRSLGLDSWCIGAGSVRNLVWNALHEKPDPSPFSDVDVAYFDADCLAPERDAELQFRLAQALPGVPWEVTNQAAVHRWFENHFGHPVDPSNSLEEAVASWPEYATSVGVRLEADDSVTIISPHGLGDLFACVVRRNPTRVSVATYNERLAQKCYAERWPKVTVMPC